MFGRKSRLLLAIILIIFGILGINAYAFQGNLSDSDTLYKLIVSIFIFIIGIGNILYLYPIKLNVEVTSEPLNESMPDQSDQAGADRSEGKTTILIVRNYEDTGLSTLESILSDHPLVLSTVQDEGRYYSVPDRDDLPEWFSLHISCKKDDCEQLMKDIDDILDNQFSKDLANSFDVREI